MLRREYSLSRAIPWLWVSDARAPCITKPTAAMLVTWNENFLVFLWVAFFNSLWPSGAIWWQRSESTLAQVMACCLTAPSHYLNHCWLIISKVQWHSISQEMPQPLITEICAKITCLKCHSNFPGSNELTRCGVVWCGVGVGVGVGGGVEWSGVEWSGVEWSGVERTREDNTYGI